LIISCLAGGGSLFNNTGNSTSRSNDLNMTSSADGLVDPSGEEITWMTRMRELQGAIILASLFEVAIGLFGLVGILLRFIGPLTIAPTITLIGVSLYGTASSYCSANWWIALLWVVLLTWTCVFLTELVYFDWTFFFIRTCACLTELVYFWLKLYISWLNVYIFHWTCIFFTEFDNLFSLSIHSNLYIF